MNQNNYAVLSDSPATLVVGDFAIADHILTFKGVPPVDTRRGQSFVIQAAVAETPGVWTSTPTAAASKNYRLSVRQWRPDLGQNVVRELSYTSKADGTDTATTICDKLRSALLAFADLKITGSGTATFIATAQTGFPMFTVTSIGDGVIAVVNGTAGVSAINTYAALTTKGIAGVVSGKSYTSVDCVYTEIGTSENVAGNVSLGQSKWTAYIQNDVTNFAAINTRINEHSDGYGAGVTTANPEVFALGA